MVLAGGILFVAGPPNVVDEEEIFSHPDNPEVRAKALRQRAILGGTEGGLLLAVAANDGKKVAEYRLDSPPVWDGMAAARGRLYLALRSGRVVCLSGK